MASEIFRKSYVNQIQAISKSIAYLFEVIRAGIVSEINRKTFIGLPGDGFQSLRKKLTFICRDNYSELIWLPVVGHLVCIRFRQLFGHQGKFEWRRLR